MDNSSKFSRLFILIFVCFVCFFAFLVGLFFFLKYFSATLIHIPGWDKTYGIIITAIPYLIFMAAYKLIFSKIKTAKRSGGRLAAFIIASVGLIACVLSLVLKSIIYFGITSENLRLFDDNSHYSLMSQLLFVMFSSMALALGDEKEKDWMEKNV